MIQVNREFQHTSISGYSFLINTKLAQKVLIERGNFGSLVDFTEIAKALILKAFERDTLLLSLPVVKQSGIPVNTGPR
jgi:hypothetical protein